jgi:predicted dithiol-disulfide oxidoreductase (DUF899 family)
MADHMGPLCHLHVKDTSFVLVSRAALPKLLAFRQRMGWRTMLQFAGTTVDGETSTVYPPLLASDLRY